MGEDILDEIREYLYVIDKELRTLEHYQDGGTWNKAASQRLRVAIQDFSNDRKRLKKELMHLDVKDI